MTKLLLSIHVIAAILAVGPIAVAASMFPRFARQAVDDQERSAAIAAVLHRICRGYAVFGIAVPVFGVATGAQLGVLTDAWLLVSIALTAVAAAVLALAVLPAQRRLLDKPREMLGTVGRLAMITGVFNVLWAIVVVLMIVRPGSTTGA
ncbi:hypothetical protein SAMN05421805_11964 [Saccharopolyspora antimicrobica]|uniref:Integral membrane protein n=1 Tax=Saccharopolyspora antimicrobica TaxID=455193 RepID=A0A1I5INS1_9PSEU|nr:hypothetical protein [Saccharopolyspora antimicrobica]RKT84084.1 hypothetical protein ATL45_2383 [Saccharopolyspora antimicrobica]SFO62285.1 hypothetical protein SAMN05421805_11964 [Saccharopolyspora antimicrobica]